MSDRRPPYHRRQTNPLPRVQLAPVASEFPDELREAETKVQCPCCEPHGGIGMVPATVRAAWLAAEFDPVVAERELRLVDPVGEIEDMDGSDEPPPAA